MKLLNEGHKLVHIERNEYSYDSWQLNGISCSHAYAAIYYSRKILEDFVDACYCKNTYIVSYALKIHAMPGPHAWPYAAADPMIPLHVRVRLGRSRKTIVRVED